MKIVKRDWNTQNYNGEKIISAIKGAFKSVNKEWDDNVLNKIEREIAREIELGTIKNTVEDIQDAVERKLMEAGFYEVCKSFILYREERAKKRQSRQLILDEFAEIDVKEILKNIEKDYVEKEYDLQNLYKKYLSFKKENIKDMQKLVMFISAACELTSQEAPKWEFIASRFMFLQFKTELKKFLFEKNIEGFYEKIQYMVKEGLYGEYILQNYSKDDIDFFESKLNEKHNNLLTYSSLRMLLSRYVIKTKDGHSIETPQEMFMGIAMHLGMNEKQEQRREFVVNFYEILSSLKVTMATPTMSNSRKPYHQLSSCFIDTVPDSLEGIYRSITNFAKVSKMGGGMGLYFGKVRAAGSDIRGFKGAAGGVIRWIRLVNDTAVAVDQLGMRQGAVAVYLDAWHRDLPEFLQLRTTNGDDRTKAHDVFPAVCMPNLFWEMARDNIDGVWSLMCPHEIQVVKGYALEDFYGEEWKEKYYDCVRDKRIVKREIPVKEIVRMLIKSAVETGTPFIFNRDYVNEYNPNPQAGIIYCSNLCTEIAQSMSPIKQLEKEIINVDGNEVVVEKTQAGNFVVCNLASLVLGNINVNNNNELKHIIRTVVRALDNVIDLNFYPIKYAQITNKKFRPIGLGVSGYHHMLAKNGIHWESEEHITFIDKLFEKINYYTIQASCDLAKEKGAYSQIKGSDWENGKYFEKRKYTTEKWKELKNDVMNNGLRNGYLLAIAPTSSTSILAGTSAGIDPIMNRYFLEEKKGAIIPRVAPDLTKETFWLYKNAHLIDQKVSIKACGVRQRHIDQAQSMNIYITNNFTMKQILNLYIYAWENGVKTLYYIRSKSLEVEECEVCSS